MLDPLRLRIREHIDGFLYNGLIAFYLKNYLVLSVIGNITRKELGSNTSLNINSVISIILTAYSLLFPFMMTFLLARNYVPQDRIKIPDSQRTRFEQECGQILKGYKVKRSFGKWDQIVTALSPLYREFFVVVAVSYLNLYPPFAIFILMYSTLIHMSYFLSHVPLEHGNCLSLFNLTVQLALTYLLLCLTPYVDESYYVDVGDAFMYLTYGLIGVNVFVRVYHSTKTAYPHIKKAYAHWKYNRSPRVKWLDLI